MKVKLLLVLILGVNLYKSLAQPSAPAPFQYMGSVDSNPNDSNIPVIVIPSKSGSYTNCSSSSRPKFGYMSSDFNFIDELVGKGPTNNVWGIPLNFRLTEVGIYSVIPRWRERISKPFQACYEREYSELDYIFILVHPVKYFDKVVLPVGDIEYGIPIIPNNLNQFSGGGCTNLIEVGYSSNQNKFFDVLTNSGSSPNYNLSQSQFIAFDPRSVGTYKLNVHSRFNTVSGGGCAVKNYSQTKSWGSIEIVVENFTWKQAPSIVCVNSSALNIAQYFNISTSNGVSFEGPGVSGVLFNPSTAGIGTHVIRAKKTYSGGVRYSDLTIQVVNTATITNTLPEKTCNSIDLSSYFTSNIAGGTWSFSAVNPSNNTNTPGVSGNVLNPNNAVLSKLKIVAQYTLGGCVLSGGSAEIDVVPGGSSALSITNPNAYCQSSGNVNLNYSLSSATASQIVWSGSGVTGSTLNVTSLEPDANVSVSLKVITSTGCELNATKLIRINSNPVLSTSTDIIKICDLNQVLNLNNEFQLKDRNTLINGVWSAPGLTIGTDGSVNLNSVTQGIFNLTYSYTNSSGCSASKLLTGGLSIHEQPNATLNVNISPASEVCATTNFILSTNGVSNNLGINWFTPNGYLGGTSTISTGSLTTGEYPMLLVINNKTNPNCFAEKTFILTVENPTPLAINNTLISSCQGDYTLNLTTKINSNYTETFFTSSNAAINSALSGEFNRNINLTGIANGNYPMTANVNVGNCVLSRDFTLNVFTEYSEPAVTGQTILCNPQATTLNVSGVNPVLQYRWFNTLNTTEQPFRTSTSYTTSLLDKNTTIYLQAYNSTTKCGSLRAPINIVVQRMDTVNVFAGEDLASCTNAVNFNLARPVVRPTTGGVWSGPGVSGTMFNGASLLNNKAYPIVYSVTRNLCTKRDTVLVTLGIDLQPIADRYVVKVGERVTFSHNYPNATSTLWNFGDGMRSTSVETTQYFYEEGSRNVSLTIQVSQNGNCQGSIVKNNFITVTDQDDIITDVEEPILDKEAFIVYPVPFDDVVSIKSNESLKNAYISIIDNTGSIIVGKQMDIKQGENVILDKERGKILAQGLYFLNIEVAKRKISFKLIKK